MTRSKRSRLLHSLLAASALTLVLGVAQAQESGSVAPGAGAATGAVTAEAYQPTVGQDGKDVVWVPTSEFLVDQMLRLAAITPQDYLVDLGAGDGRLVIAAAQHGTRAHGVEFNPDMVRLARQAARNAGVSERASFAQSDIFESDFSDATVVTLFLLPELNLRLRPTLLEMKPGTRVVSNSFDMGDWEPDDTADGGPHCQSFCLAYKWIVPARVDGTWMMGGEVPLTLSQTFQKLSGHLVSNGKQREISRAVMQGDRISFVVDGQQYTGRVEAGRMTGLDSSGNAWFATRQEVSSRSSPRKPPLW